MQNLESVLLADVELRQSGLGLNANAALVGLIDNYDVKLSPFDNLKYICELGFRLCDAAAWPQVMQLSQLIQNTYSEAYALIKARLYCEQEKFRRANQVLLRLSSSDELVNFYMKVERLRIALRKREFITFEDIFNSIDERYYAGSVIAQSLRARYYLFTNQRAKAAEIIDPLLAKGSWYHDVFSVAAILYKEQCISLWELALKRQPNHFESLYNIARHFLSVSEGEKGLEFIDYALNVKPWSVEAANLKIEILKTLRRLDEAQKLAEELFHVEKTGLQAAVYLDVLRLSNSSKSSIEKILNELIGRYKNDPAFLLAAGNCWVSLGELNNAQECFRRRLSIIPNDVPALSNIGKVLYDKGLLEDAISTWQSIPNPTLEVQRNLAFALLDAGRVEKAELSISELLNRNPNDPLALLGKAELCIDKGNMASAKSSIDIALNGAGYLPRTWFVASRYALMEYGWKAAESVLLKGIQVANENISLKKQLFSEWRKRNLIPNNFEHIKNWINNDPKNVSFILMLAEAYFQIDDNKNAEMLIDEAEKIDGITASSTKYRFLIKVGRYDDAITFLRNLIKKHPDAKVLYGFLAESLAKANQYKEAIACINSGLRYQRDNFELMRQKISILLAAGEIDSAISFIEREANYLDDERSWRLLLNTYKKAGLKAKALELSEVRFKDGRERVFWLFELALGLNHFGNRKEAIRVLEEELRLDSGNLSIALSLADALQADEQYNDAVHVLRNFLKNDQSPSSLVRVARALLNAGELQEAASISEAGLRTYPNYFDLYDILSDCYYRSELNGRLTELVNVAYNCIPITIIAPWALDQAIRLNRKELVEEAFQKWLLIDPNSIEALWGKYEFCKAFMNLDEASEILERLRLLRPKDVKVLRETITNRSDQWKLSEAIRLAQQLCTHRPSDPMNWAILLNQKWKAGEYNGFDTVWTRMIQEYGESRYSQYPNFFFNMNCHPTWSASEVYRYYADWYEKSIKPSLSVPKRHQNNLDPERVLNIGYISPDFCNHPVAFFSEALLREHDRNNFRITAFSHLKPGLRDEYTQRFKSYVDSWVDITLMSDDELYREIKSRNIDILVDLAGHTAHNRLSLLTRRPAPIQISWIIGAGQTTGLKEIDYFFVDSNIIPEGYEKYFSENVMRLPSVGIPYSPPNVAPKPTELPALNNKFITFGVLARPLRTNDVCFIAWSNILKKSPKSIIRFDHAPYAEKDIQERIKNEFVKQNISEERLVFGNTRPYWDVFSKIDIVLDPFPAGSGTVSTEALYMARPVIALESRPPVGRITASQLKAVNVDTFCLASSVDEYVTKATALANDLKLLSSVSAHLSDFFSKSFLMDYKKYGGQISDAYRSIWRNWTKNCEVQE